MEHIFLDLGTQPMANNFLLSEDIGKEYLYNLQVKFNDDTKLVSLVNFVPPDMMFNEHYAYRSSLSTTMLNHFKQSSELIKNRSNGKNILEIGSDDGVFIRNFDKENVIAVEPCGNFCKMTNDMGYKTYNEFWTSTFAKKLNKTFDVIFAANCMCHIQDLDDAFEGINIALDTNGIFVFEDPSLLSMIDRVSYDQLYDEHAHIFSVTALSNILKKHNLEIFDVDKLSVHGGSNRIWVKKTNNTNTKTSHNVKSTILTEKWEGVSNINLYNDFAKNVEKSKHDLLTILTDIKRKNKKIISYGATSKSTTVFNYCGITTDFIDYIVDTTPEKQGKYMPGVYIPIIPYNTEIMEDVDYAFLGAWNYENEIVNKEINFVNNGGKFITHVPYTRILP